MIDVIGHGFLDLPTLACRFGLVAGNAIFVSSEYVQCFTPMASMPGNVSLELTLNGVDYTVQGANFEFMPMASLSMLAPAAGLLRGGMPVEVGGSGFAPIVRGGTRVTCRWEMPGPDPREILATLALISNDSMLACVTPPAAEAGKARVSVFADGVRIVDENDSAFTFEYEHDTTTTALIPSHGQPSGGTRIKITGEGFGDTRELICRFYLASAGGGSDGTPGNDRVGKVDVPGQFVSTTEVHCLTPAFAEIQPIGGFFSGHALVEVLNHKWTPGDERVSRGLSFWYRPQPKVCAPAKVKSIEMFSCFHTCAVSLKTSARQQGYIFGYY